MPPRHTHIAAAPSCGAGRPQAHLELVGRRVQGPGRGAPAVFTDTAPGGAFGDADAEECPRPNSAALVMMRGALPGRMRDGRGMPGEITNDAPGRAAARCSVTRADGASRRTMSRGLHTRAGPAGVGGRRGRRRDPDNGRNRPGATRPRVGGIRRYGGFRRPGRGADVEAFRMDGRIYGIVAWTTGYR